MYALIYEPDDQTQAVRISTVQSLQVAARMALTLPALIAALSRPVSPHGRLVVYDEATGERIASFVAGTSAAV